MARNVKVKVTKDGVMPAMEPISPGSSDMKFKKPQKGEAKVKA